MMGRLSCTEPLIGQIRCKEDAFLTVSALPRLELTLKDTWNSSLRKGQIQ